MNFTPKKESSSPLVEILRNANFSYWLESIGEKPSTLAMQRAILHLSNPQVYPKVNIGPRVKPSVIYSKNATSETSSQAAASVCDLPCYSGGIRIPSQEEIKRLKIPKKSSSSSFSSTGPESSLSKVGNEPPNDSLFPVPRASSSDKNSKKHTKDSEKKKDKSTKKDSSASKSRRESQSKDKSYSKSHSESDKSQISKPSNESYAVVESRVVSNESPSVDTPMETPAATSSKAIDSLEDRLARVVGQVLPSQLIPEPLADRPAHLLAHERRDSGDSTDSKGRKRKKDSQSKDKKEKRKKEVHTSEICSDERILLRISRDAIRDYSSVVTTPPPKESNNLPGQQPEQESASRSDDKITEKETVCDPMVTTETITVALSDQEDEATCLSNTTDENLGLDDDVATEPNSEAEEADFDGMTTPVFTNVDFREVGIKQEKVAPSFVEMATQTEVEAVIAITTVSGSNAEPSAQSNESSAQAESPAKKADVQCQTEESGEEGGEDELMALEGDLLMNRLRELEQKAHECLVGVVKDVKEREKLQTEGKSKLEVYEATKKRLETFESERNTVLTKERECEQSMTEVKKKVDATKQETMAWKRKELELKIATNKAELAVLYFKRDRGVESDYKNDPEYLALISKKNGLKEEYDNYFARLKELEEQLTVQEGALAVAEDLYNAHRAERERVDKEMAEFVGNSESAQKDCAELQSQMQKLSEAITSKQLEALNLKHRVLKVQLRLRDTKPLGTVIVLLPPQPEQAPALNDKDQFVGMVLGNSTPTASPDSSQGESPAQTPSELPESFNVQLVHEYIHFLFSVHVSLYTDLTGTLVREQLVENCRRFSSVALKMSRTCPEYSTKTGYAKITDLFSGFIRATPSFCNQCQRNVLGLPTYERVMQIFRWVRKVENAWQPRLTGFQNTSVVQRGEPNDNNGDQTGNGRLPTIRVKPLSHLYGMAPPPLTPQEASHIPASNEQTANVVNANGTQPSVPFNQQRMLGPPVIQQVRIPQTSFSPNGAMATSQSFEQRPPVPPYPATVYSSQQGQQNVGPNTIVYAQAMNGQSVSSYGSNVPNQTGQRISTSDVRTPLMNTGMQYGHQRPQIVTQVLCIMCKKPAHHYCVRCNAVPYCSSGCQNTDWPRHGTVCKVPVNYGVTNRMHGT